MPKENKTLAIGNFEFLPLSSSLPEGVGSEPGFTTANDTASFPSIGLKNNVFRLNTAGGDEVTLGAEMLMTFVAMSQHQQRVLFEGEYDPDERNEVLCASDDGVTPLPCVPEKQSDKCVSCPMSKKGSGKEGRIACSVKRTALVCVWLPDGPQLYRMNISWASFGQKDDQKNKLFNVRNFGKMCKKLGLPEDGLVVRATFDHDKNAAPSTVRFTPVAMLTPEQYAMIQAELEDVDVDQVIYMAGMFGCGDDDSTPEAKPKPKPKPKPQPATGDARVSMRTSGRGKVLVCLEQAKSFDGPTSFTIEQWRLPANCLIQIDGAKGILQVGGSGTTTCDKQGDGVVCSPSSLP